MDFYLEDVDMNNACQVLFQLSESQEVVLVEREQTIQDAMNKLARRLQNMEYANAKIWNLSKFNNDPGTVVFENIELKPAVTENGCISLA